jgi:hypothetical protein
MHGREIAYRAGERVRSDSERFGFVRRVKAPAGFLHYLGGEARRRFYRGATETPPFSVWVERAVADAEALCRHEMKLFHTGTPGLEARAKSKIDWHHDPVSGRPWPQRFWRDYDLEAAPYGLDAKLVHELNRQQHLPRLAKAYRWTGDERYAAEAVAQLLGWIEQNPPGRGVNWHSSLEIALRVVSWLWTLIPLLGSPSLGQERAQRVGDALFAQLDHVYRYLSVYSSPNTHLLGEAWALFIGGTVFQTPAWQQTGAALLERESEKQILDDGVHAELSTYYHCYALDFYLQALILAEQNGVRFAPSVYNRVEAMVQFVMHVSTPDGAVPPIGDDDGGRALALHHRSYRSFRDALCTSAVLFRRGDFKGQAREFAEETWLMLGSGSWDRYREIAAHHPAARELFCPKGGYFVQRSGWGTRDSQLIFDCGGLGMLAGGHSHAASLSVTLHAGGRALLIDPGTFVYNGAADWRRYFRSTAAHNTVEIDGRDQAAMSGTFRWKTRIPFRNGRRQGLGIQCVEGEHGGYAPNVTHLRRVVYIPGEYWMLLDDFTGSGSHHLRFHFHLGPDVGAFMPAVCTSHSSELRLVTGWASAGYGEKHPISTLQVEMAAEMPAAAVTFLPCAAERPAVEWLDVESAIVCSYRHGNHCDIAVLPRGDGEVHVEGLTMLGEFFWFRMEGDALKDWKAIGARKLRFHGQDFLEGAPCAQLAAF